MVDDVERPDLWNKHTKIKKQIDYNQWHTRCCATQEAESPQQVLFLLVVGFGFLNIATENGC
jgi:hypothetical protein